MKSVTQLDKILMMLKGQPITALDALKYAGCMRLVSRIAELKKDGYHINKRMVKVVNGSHVAEYSLERDEK